MAALFATMEKDPEDATRFWESVHSGENLKKNDPVYQLREKFLNKYLVNRLGIRGKELIDQERMYRACIIAWNAFRVGKKVEYFRVDCGGNRPKVI
ncbi:MAG: hypothetical protein H7831_06720 [Magnetococcus sp. WYHC-3]